MKGYLRNDEANEKAFSIMQKDGGEKQQWLRTGDVAKIDERGYITITDRLKDVIKAKGFQVSPAELEGMAELYCEEQTDKDHEYLSYFIQGQSNSGCRCHRNQRCQRWFGEALGIYCAAQQRRAKR